MLFFFFAFSAIRIAIKMGNEYDFIFATSSRLATSYLGFIISKITKKHLYLDIRDIFSDNIKSIKLFRGKYWKSF